MSASIRRASDVSCTWLEGALGAAGRGVGVEAVDVTPVGGSGEGDGGTFRVTPTYRGAQPDLPRSFIVKTPSGGDRSAAVSECAFHASVADRVRLPVPECHFVEIDDSATDFVLVLTDVAPAAAVDPAQGCDEERARLAAAAIAGLHAPTWCEPEWLRFTGLTASLPDSAAATALGETARTAAERILERFGAHIAAEDRETLVAAMDVVTSWVSAVHGRYSLLHGDYRTDHVLFGPDGAGLWVVGWRALAVGLPARDLACFAGTGLGPALRSALDHDLVTEYHAALRNHGVAAYDLETCWHDYRYAMIQAPLTCALVLAAVGVGEREPVNLLAMLRRGCAAVRDLQTLDLVAAVTAAEAAAAQYLTHVNVH